MKNRFYKLKIPRWLAIGLPIAFVLIIALLIVNIVRHDQYKDLSNIQTKINELVNLERTNNIEVVSEEQLFQPVALIRKEINSYNIFAANTSLKKLKTEVTGYSEKAEVIITQKHTEEAAQAALAAQRVAAEAVKAPHNNPIVAQIRVPIIMYHKPPADFDTQMATLKAKGYSTVNMKDIADAFAGKASLPPKPAVITFDDGFAAQQDTIPILQKYGIKVTLYLIEGGSLSHYCIGLKRIDGEACGDAYLKPDNVKQMMQSGLIEIGAHTVDHPNLTTMSAADQWFQIAASKTYLEQTFSVPVTTFAYPYGSYNSTTVVLVSKAGFATAVTTEPGILQNPQQPYLLHRIRDTYSLP